MGLKFKLSGQLKTKYKYDQNFAENLTKVIAANIQKEFDSMTIITNNSIDFKNILFNFRIFNTIIPLFHFSIDSGIIKVINQSGKLVLNYKVSFIRGLIFLYSFLGFLALIAILNNELNLFSEEMIVLLILPPGFILLGVLMSLRFLNIVLEKCLKIRYMKFEP